MVVLQTRSVITRRQADILYASALLPPRVCLGRRVC
jgi:hypothetical protein